MVLLSIESTTEKMKLLLLIALCGLAAVQADKIVNGSPATAGQIPFIVRVNQINFNFCDGSIYSEWYIISAAHCMESSSLTGINIIAGDVDRDDTTGLEQKISIDKEVRHASYSSATMRNDIMLVKLKESLSMVDGSVEAIALYTSALDDGAPAYVAGWGTTSSGGTTSDDLLYALVYVNSTQECQSAYHTANDISRITDEASLCLSAWQTDSCQGDSGGPAYVTDDENMTYGGTYLVGIVSWGYGCAEPGYPGVYTKVSTYSDWVVSSVSAIDAAGEGSVSLGCVDDDGLFTSC